MLEATLMSGLACEGSASFELILRKWQTLVLRTAYRILGNWADAEDVAQEAFLKLHRHGVGFSSDAALGAWLYRVTVNLCFDRGRSRRSKELAAEELPASLSEAAAAESGMIREQEKARLMAALARLPVKERAAVVLREGARSAGCAVNRPAPARAAVPLIEDQPAMMTLKEQRKD